MTTDGVVHEGLFTLAEALPGEEAPTSEMVAAAQKLLALLPSALLDRLCYDADAHEWQSWANPEFMQHDTGSAWTNSGTPNVMPSWLWRTRASAPPRDTRWCAT